MTGTTARQDQTATSFAGRFGINGGTSLPQASDAVLSVSKTRRAAAKCETTGTRRGSFLSVLLRALSAISV